MSESTSVLLLCQKCAYTNLIKFKLQSLFAFEVHEFETVKDFSHYLDGHSGSYFLVVADESAGVAEVERAYGLLEQKDAHVPFFYISQEATNHDLNVTQLDRANAIETIGNAVKDFFVENPEIPPLEFCPISFDVLTAFKGIKSDVYLKFPSGRHIKIFQEKDSINDEDVEKYLKKGVRFLYLKQTTAHWILKQIDESPQTFIDALERGENFQLKGSAPEVKIDGAGGGGEKIVYDNKRKIYGEGNTSEDDFGMNKKEKTYAEEDENIELVDNVQLMRELNQQFSAPEAESPIDSEEKEDHGEDAPHIEHSQESIKACSEINGVFQLSEQFIEEVDKKVLKATKVMAKNPTLKKLLEKMALDRDPTKYFNNHVNVLCRVSCALAHLLEWGHESTIEKLIFCCYLHDITLVDYPHLAAIQTLEEFEDLKNDLSPQEQKLYLSHPEDVKVLIESLNHAPVDAEKIIYQHHELPDKSGFPGKLNHQRILPLAALFIVAHDLTVYILQAENWNLKEYIQFAQYKFTIGQNFTKIIRKIKSLEL